MSEYCLDVWSQPDVTKIFGTAWRNRDIPIPGPVSAYGWGASPCYHNSRMDDWENARQEKLKRDRLKEQALQFASPELRERMERDEQDLREAVAAKNEAVAAKNKERDQREATRIFERAVANVFGWLLIIALGIGISIGSVYALVKLVKWAWLN